MVTPLPTETISSVFNLPIRPPEECLILVVDDDEMVVEMFAALLKLDGYQVVTATDGLAAWNIIQQDHPDVAVLDVLLPGLDGIELCRQIKNDPTTQFLPVILVTGLTADEKRIEGLNANADDFLEKPPDPVALKARVRSLLRMKHLYDELEAHRRELEERVAERTQELRAAYERLQALSRVKGNILGIASHELRTPTHQAKIALHLARQEGMDPARRESLLDEAQQSFGLLEYRIEDIETFSDPTDIILTPNSIRDLLVGAVDKVRTLRRGREDEIILDVAKGISPVMVSGIPMKRALTHIIFNAAKFGEGKPIYVRAVEEENAVRVSVEDQGPGIKPEIMPVLFAPLEQGDARSTRLHGGLGIGLALVKMTADAHQIPIAIQTEQGKGTTITMMMPIAYL